MPSFSQSFGRAAARFTTRNPERLWRHYAFAMTLFFILLLGTYLLNNLAADRTRMAAEGISASNQQLRLIRDVVAQASDWSAVDDPDAIALHKAINRLDVVNRHLSDLMKQQGTMVGSAAFPDLAAIKPMQSFLDTARQLSQVSADQRVALHRELTGIFQSQVLHQVIIANSGHFAQKIMLDAREFSTLRDILLMASAVVLILEAALVFWPAQMTVKSTIKKLQRQKQVLTSSKSRLKKLNARLAYALRHDQLTELPNRSALITMLEQRIQRRETADVTLLLLGLDGFKSINDMIGHDYGDALLIRVGQTLCRCVDDDDIVARVGGDEFVVVSDEHESDLLQRIMISFREPFEVGGRRIPIKASIGFLKIGTAIREPGEIIADAEIALQFAKAEGGDRTKRFDRSLRENLSAMQQLQLELMEAIRNGEIEPWFQPQVRLSDGRLHGAEVLARWRHPHHGLLTPDKFLPAAERAGLVIDLDHAIWRAAMQHANGWQGLHDWRPSISLNAAPDTIADPNLIERFLLAVNRSGLDIDQVVVEVLETTLITSNDDMAAINIDGLAECGVALELDDFGTGYASLSKLTQLPLAGIKLDRSLITPLPDQAADSVIRAILALAGELGLKVIAEGIEEQEQASHLDKRGCLIGQGYGFGRPMPADEFAKWLKKHASHPVDVVEQQPMNAKQA